MLYVSKLQIFFHFYKRKVSTGFSNTMPHPSYVWYDAPSRQKKQFQLTLPNKLNYKGTKTRGMYVVEALHKIFMREVKRRPGRQWAALEITLLH